MKQRNLGLGRSPERRRRREFPEEMGCVAPRTVLVSQVRPHLPEAPAPVGVACARGEPRSWRAVSRSWRPAPLRPKLHLSGGLPYAARMAIIGKSTGPGRSNSHHCPANPWILDEMAENHIVAVLRTARKLPLAMPGVGSPFHSLGVTLTIFLCPVQQ